MAIPTGIRPRNDDERKKLHSLLYDAPPVVGIGVPDDGWIAACVWISGRRPVWCNDADPQLTEQFLQRMGLPPLSDAAPEAIIGSDLTLDRPCTAGFNPLPAPKGETPKVTILICTYNRAHLIEEAIDSARMQTWPREILIINDGSDDGTTEILDGLDGHDGIRVIHKANGGKPSALNVGIDAARGEAMLVLDDDDRLCPGALHVLGRALVNHPRASVINGDTACFHGETGRPKVYMPASRLPGRTGAEAVLQQVPAMPGASLIRMSSQRAAGLYDMRLIRGQDMDMYLRLSRQGDFETVPLPTFLYRSHDGLRGSAAGQWRRSETSKHEDKFMACVSPVFMERYRAAQPISDRAMAHCWALGLHLRRLNDEARTEMLRWPGPHTAREKWMRDQVGVDSTIEPLDSTMVVVDDGDPGALELTLQNHADTHRLWINLEVPRDPLGHIRLYWQGEYAARQRLKTWCTAEGPIHVRLSSAPDWAPPPIPTALWFPDLPAIDALLALTAPFNWSLPERTRHGLRAPLLPVVVDLLKCRAFLNQSQPDAALAKLLPALKAMPTWPGVWKLAAEAFQARGDIEKAQQSVKRIERLQSAG